MGLARSERSLDAAARRGNRDAIDELLRRYQAALYRVAFGITGSPAGALDVVQDVFVKVYQRFQYDGRSKFHTWLHRVTANEALNWRKRERFDEPPLEIEAAAEMPWPAPDAERTAITKQELARLLALMDRLNETERQAITLRYFEGCSVGEIAEALEMSEAVTSTTIFRARQKLRELRRKANETVPTHFRM